MDSEKLETLLDGGSETPNFDIKKAMPWDAPRLAKHLMAMSNVRDGGSIVIGVDDATFNRTGVDEPTRKTYNEEVMRDQMATYADPGVEFRVSFPIGNDSLVYIAIEVSSFRDVPIICKRNGPNSRIGAVYYRSSNRRVASAEIDNSYDMRDLLNLAASRVASRNRDFGFIPDPGRDSFSDELDQELGDL